MLVVKDGYLACPHCRLNKRLYRVNPEDEAKQVTLWCRNCKREVKIEISKGQCFESRSQ